jgi:dTDP-4-dehydrorhamnose 3,5-epimerase-like enzyme
MISPQIIQLPKILDARGNLTFLQNGQQFPFTIQRVFWIYDVPGGEYRGGHAFKTQNEIIVALSGSFEVVVTDRNGSIQSFSLNRSYNALFLPQQTWRHIENFSTNAVALHLVDKAFDEADYIRDFELFKQG